MAVIKSQISGFPVNMDEADITRAKVQKDGQLRDLIDVIDDAQTDALAGLTPTADSMPYFTGVTTADTTPLTAFARSILDDANEAAFKATVNLEIGVDVQAYDADTLKADVADTLTVGFDATAYSAGTKSSGTFTPDPALGNFQTATNGGAHTLAPPSSTCSIVVQYTNNGSAGTITTSGFTLVSGDTPTTTNGDDFFAYIVKIGSFSHLTWVALQ